MDTIDFRDAVRYNSVTEVETVSGIFGWCLRSETQEQREHAAMRLGFKPGWVLGLLKRCDSSREFNCY